MKIFSKRSNKNFSMWRLTKKLSRRGREFFFEKLNLLKFRLDSKKFLRVKYDKTAKIFLKLEKI